MRLDPRILLPAALAAAALALPATGIADPPDTHIFCPNSGDPNSMWVPQSTIIGGPAAEQKDNNGDTVVCQKVDNDQPVKDNNNPPPSSNPDDYVDNILP
jgi:hypothetical protein